MRKSARAKSPTSATPVTRKFLRTWQIQEPDSDGSKEERGRVLVVGGDRQIPGAVLLAGTAALRAGAGKLQIATCESAAVYMGIAIPEALVMRLAETDDGFIRGSSFEQVVKPVERTHSVLIGPGMTSATETEAFVAGIIPHAANCTVVLDAGALAPLGGNRPPLPAANVKCVITPHAGEMAAILGAKIESVEANAPRCATEVASALGAVVVLKGPETHIVSPSGEHYVYTGGDVGLATSGSGDILAGIIAGLAARTDDPLQAAVLGVFVHGEAGNALAKKSGRVGYLARELLVQIPPILNQLSESA